MLESAVVLNEVLSAHTTSIDLSKTSNYTEQDEVRQSNQTLKLPLKILL